MSRRQEFSQPERDKADARANGHCEQCGMPFHPIKNPREFDHDKECWEGGDASPKNCKAIGKYCCHQPKTAASAARRAKADAAGKYHRGEKKRKGPAMPGTRRSGWRKRMDGTVEKR